MAIFLSVVYNVRCLIDLKMTVSLMFKGLKKSSCHDGMVVILGSMSNAVCGNNLHLS